MKKLQALAIVFIICSCSNNSSEKKISSLELYGQYHAKYGQEAKDHEKAIDQIGLIMNDTLTIKSVKLIDSLIQHISQINQSEEFVLGLASTKHNNKSMLFFLIERTKEEVPPTPNWTSWRRLQRVLTPKEHSYHASKVLFSKNYDMITIDTLTTNWWRFDTEFTRWTIDKVDTTGMSAGRRKLLIEILNQEDFFLQTSSNAKPHTRLSSRSKMRKLFDPNSKHTSDIIWSGNAW